MNKKTVEIKGMHCRSCEMMIEEEMLKVPGIDKVKVSAKKGTADIFYKDAPPAEDAINDAVKAAGYQAGSAGFSLFSGKLTDYTDLVTAVSSLIIFYLVAEASGLLKLNLVAGGDYGNLLTVMLIGLTAGFSSCMALIGGLVLGLASRFAEKHPQSSLLARFRPHLFFNLGGSSRSCFSGGLLDRREPRLNFHPPRWAG